MISRHLLDTHSHRHRLCVCSLLRAPVISDFMLVEDDIIHVSKEQSPRFREEHILEVHCIISPQL